LKNKKNFENGILGGDLYPSSSDILLASGKIKWKRCRMTHTKTSKNVRFVCSKGLQIPFASGTKTL